MTTPQVAAGKVRYLYRLRVSKTAEHRLREEWGRGRWVWNECVATSSKVHRRNKVNRTDDTCGPAWLDKLLTEAREQQVAACGCVRSTAAGHP